MFFVKKLIINVFLWNFVCEIVKIVLFGAFEKKDKSKKIVFYLQIILEK